MSLPTKRAAYPDCYTLYEAAIASPTGVRTPTPTLNAAKLLQLRMNQAREILRSESRRIYPREDPLHDTSEFDGYAVKVRGPDAAGEYWVMVEPHGVKLTHIEAIEEESADNG